MLKEMKYIIRTVVLLVSFSTLFECVSTTLLSHNEVLQRYDEIVALQSHLQQAEKKWG